MPPIETPTNYVPRKEAACRTCTDFQSWAKQQRQIMEGERQPPNNGSDAQSPKRENCPLDKDELGRNTWSLFHTMAAHYPDNPSKEVQNDYKTFFNLMGKYYPCDFCAQDFRKELQSEPVVTDSYKGLSQWLCRIHNKVNAKLGKSIFDCSKVDERWRDGWADGSCD